MNKIEVFSELGYKVITQDINIIKTSKIEYHKWYQYDESQNKFFVICSTFSFAESNEVERLEYEMTKGQSEEFDKFINDVLKNHDL